MIYISGIVDSLSASLKDQIFFIKKAKLEYIELRNISSKNIIFYKKRDIVAMKEILRKEDVKVSAICTPIGKDKFKFFHKTKTKIMIKKALRYSNILDCKYIRIFFDSKLDEKKIKKIYSYSYRVNPNIIICMENEINTGFSTYVAMQNTIENLKVFKNFKVLLDTGNFFEQNEININDFYNKYYEYISHVHVKDFSKKSNKTIEI